MSFTFIHAGAGCGKTTWIINKIIALIEKEKNNLLINKKILLITYTNSCVEELVKRLGSQLENFHDFVDIFTFHALCHEYMDLEGIFSEDTNLELLLSYMEESYNSSFVEFYNYYLCHRPITLKEYGENLDIFYKDALLMENISDVDLGDFITLDGKIRTKIPSHIDNREEWLKTREGVIKHFTYLKKHHNLEYFQRCLLIEEVRKDVQIYTYQHIILNVLDNIHVFLSGIYNKYVYFFIDEVQDLSHIQFKIIEALGEELVYHPHHSITIVGDIHQSIYSFQGANQNNFYAFINKIKSIETLQYVEETLNRTYRFGGEILNFVNRHFHEHRSTITQGEIILYPLSKNNSQLLESVYDAIVHTMASLSGSILVLFQSRSNLTMALEEKFKSVKIRQKISAQDDMLSTFFSLLKYIITQDENHLIKFLLGSMFIVEEPEFYYFIQKNRNNIFEALQGEYGKREEVNLLLQLTNMTKTEEFLNIFTHSIFHRVAYGVYGNNINILLTHLTTIKSTTLLDLLYLENKDLYFDKNGLIHFSTVHNSKGMEGDHVFIIDGNKSPKTQSITLFNNCPFYNFFTYEEGILDEFKNLLYVSITRAKQSLHIFGQGIKINDYSLYSYFKIQCK